MHDDQQYVRQHGAEGTPYELARGLGWFSIGLGLAELLAPRGLAEALGMEEHSGLIRAYGARELATGIGILASEDPTPWMWGRVGGDALDLATLASGLSEENPQRGAVMLAMAAVAGVTMLDIYCAQQLTSQRSESWVPMPDYSDRSGLPRPPSEMRGAASDYETPRDMRAPELMRPYPTAATSGATAH
jgi:hypothetical protein